MKVSNNLQVSSKFNHNKTTSISTNNNNITANQITKLNGVPKSYALSFSGGYSLSLEQTMSEFDKMEQKTGRAIVPLRVKAAAEEVLERGNPDNLTLVDIHKKVYEDINNADSLEEIRENFPEFRNIKSANDVYFKESSLLDSINEGKSKIFTQDEDLTLQLMKLYWAEGFSLKDVSGDEYKKGNIANVMEKLNIPRQDCHYGHILKFSDKEYNKRFTEAMSVRQEEIAARKSGSPYIPRQMSDEQKKKISESLIKFYIEHPEKIQEMTAQQKEFYKKNAGEAIFFKFVMLNTWSSNPMQVVRRKMSEYLKNKTNGAVLEYSTDFQNNEGQGKILKDFWQQNPYLRKKFSTALAHSYQKLKNDTRYDVVKSTLDIPAFPAEVVKGLVLHAQQNNINVNNYNISLGFYCADTELLAMTKEFKLLQSYFNANPDKIKLLKETMKRQVLGLLRYYKSDSFKCPEGDEAIKHIEEFLKNSRKTSISKLMLMYAKAVSVLKTYGKTEDVARFTRFMNRTYNELLIHNQRQQAGYGISNFGLQSSSSINSADSSDYVAVDF